MGMCLGLITISDDNIDRVLADPPLIWKIVAPDDPEPYRDARKAQQKPAFLSWIFGKAPEAAVEPEELVQSEGEGIETDLDKAWHGLHYLLTREAWEGDPPLNFLVLGGTEVPDIEVGYGAARLYRAAETREILDALGKVTDAELSARFDPEDMMAKEIYPEIWDRDPKDDPTMQYLLDYLGTLRGFLAQTVEAGMGIVVCLT